MGAVSLQDALALGRNIFRHAEGNGKIFCRTDHGIGDTGIAAGGIEKRNSRAELSRGSAFGNNAGRSPVFDRPAGVVPLGLAQKLQGRKATRNSIEAQKRSVAN